MGDLIFVPSGPLNDQVTEENKWKCYALLADEHYNMCLGVYLHRVALDNWVSNKIQVCGGDFFLNMTTWLYMKCMEVCKHWLCFFFIALVSYCTCTGCMATVQHLYGSVCLLGTPTCMCTGKYSYQHTFREKERCNPLTRWALPHQNYERSESCTILCQYRYGTVHLCSVEKE